MTYYETSSHAKVFAGGAIDFGGSAMITPVRRMLEKPVGTPGDAVVSSNRQTLVIL